MEIEGLLRIIASLLCSRDVWLERESESLEEDRDRFLLGSPTDRLQPNVTYLFAPQTPGLAALLEVQLSFGSSKGIGKQMKM